MTPQEYSKAQVATACWRAAQGELHSVMLCVAMVFKNRAEAGYYESDLYENAVAWLKENPGEFPDIRDPQFTSLLLKLDNVTSGQVADKTGGALWFYPKQELEDMVAPFTITTTIGGLAFLKCVR